MTYSGYKEEEIVVVLVGRSSSGKTTLLQNLVGEEIDKEIATTKEIKVCCTTRNGTRIKIVDMPCLRGKFDASFDILIYCLPVGPGSKFEDTNPELMQSLQKCYGKDIWKHCIIAFTFSDMAWDHTHYRNADSSSAITLYNDTIENFLDKFRQELKNKLKVKDANFRSVFDCKADSFLISCEKRLAIPTSSDPLQLHGKGWRDDILNEILQQCVRKVSCHQRIPLENYNKNFFILLVTIGSMGYRDSILPIFINVILHVSIIIIMQKIIKRH